MTWRAPRMIAWIGTWRATVNKWIPAPHEIVREGFIVIGGVILAAIVLSRFPALKQWIADQGTITLKDGDGKTTLWN